MGGKLLKLLRSTRLSAYLMAALLALFILGQIIPQRELFTAREGRAWQEANPRLYAVLDALDLLELYTSPLAIVLLAAFMVNLVLVLAARFHVTVSRCRRPGPGPVEGGAAAVELGDKGEEEVLTVIRRMLPRYRMIAGEGRFVAYQNRFGPVGFLLFHASFVVLLLAGLALFYTRSVGTAAVTEGQAFSGAPGEYRSLRLPLVGEPPSVRFTVLHIKPTYEEGQPTDLEVRIAVFGRGGEPRKKTIGVNQPYTRGDTSMLIKSIDVAPLIKLQSADGEVVYEYAFVSLKVLGGGMDSYVFPYSIYRADFQFFPDFAVEGGLEYSRSPETRNPRFHVYLYESGRKVLDRVMGPGETGRAGEVVFAVEELRYWAEFTVVRERGRGLLWAGFIIGITGLVWRFFFYRREVRGEFRDGTLLLAQWSEMPAGMRGPRLEDIVRELKGRAGG
jgi:cytochrome c biogenesis protein ResB